MTGPKTYTIPAAWLTPLPADYKIPLWRWILLPASAWMLSRNGGQWVGGEFSIRLSAVHFARKGLIKTGRPAEWSIPFARIHGISSKKGIASEIIEIHHTDGKTKIMSVRAEEFIELLRVSVSTGRSGANEDASRP
ncbi:hypothetical protein [Neorhizobium vignae]|uniref:hypothetical protein n=1 Tax=Neorhizobium vignae TaxID=690585 RepID=UPI0012683C5A|nr:hypothetical protein [Neorhizobium vignae]